MIDEQEIINTILDNDGSGRDLRVNKLTCEEACLLIINISYLFTLKSNSDENGNSVLGNDPSEYQNSICRSNTFHSYWENGNGIMKDIQLFYYRTEDGFFCPEITFFPDAIKNDLNFTEFVAFLKKLFFGLAIKEFYLGYESVAWEYGDTTEGSGVFLTHRDIVL